ncbi:XdhC family protein [Reichenbachiella versicolor]|uniref:XdhC family protein n=1 Tax=Reichenbachiella versicolor TaxID=1821036 RepID=UPI000D6E541F|nr:XdhC family protein [Reichenbachiella versicolor]
MSDIRKIVSEYQRLKSEGVNQLALVTVLEVYGSSFRRPGAMMLVTANSRWYGAISGGCLEGDALKRAKSSLKEGKPSIVMYDTVNDEENALGPRIGCNGIVKVMIEPIKSNWLDELAMLDMNQGGFFVTKISQNQNSVFRAFLSTEGEKLFSEIDGWPPERDFEQMVNVSTKSGDGEWIVQELPALKKIVICGGGNHIVPLINLAKTIGWEVTLTDPCVAHSAPALYPQADNVIMQQADQVSEGMTALENTAFVITSHSPDYIKQVLSSTISNGAQFVGLIGNRIRLQKVLTEQFGKTIPTVVKAPVGLDLGGNTPEEMSLSIVAEVQAFFNKKAGLPLSQGKGYIHDRRAQEIERDSMMKIK